MTGPTSTTSRRPPRGAAQQSRPAARSSSRCDFDGTLAPIVDHPSDARARRRRAEALSALAALPRTTVALVSGRPLLDLRTMTALGPRVAARRQSRRRARLTTTVSRRPAPARPARSATSASSPTACLACSLEHKPAGVAVHVRTANREDAARVTVRRWSRARRLAPGSADAARQGGARALGRGHRQGARARPPARRHRRRRASSTRATTSPTSGRSRASTPRTSASRSAPARPARDSGSPRPDRCCPLLRLLVDARHRRDGSVSFSP